MTEYCAFIFLTYTIFHIKILSYAAPFKNRIFQLKPQQQKLVRTVSCILLYNVLICRQIPIKIFLLLPLLYKHKILVKIHIVYVYILKKIPAHNRQFESNIQDDRSNKEIFLINYKTHILVWYSVRKAYKKI